MHNNAFLSSFEQQIRLYLRCAIQLQQSLINEGVEVVVLTNEKAFLESLKETNDRIAITQLKFHLKVNTGIKNCCVAILF